MGPRLRRDAEHAAQRGGGERRNDAPAAPDSVGNGPKHRVAHEVGSEVDRVGHLLLPAPAPFVLLHHLFRVQHRAERKHARNQPRDPAVQARPLLVLAPAPDVRDRLVHRPVLLRRARARPAFRVHGGRGVLPHLPRRSPVPHPARGEQAGTSLHDEALKRTNF